MVLQENMEFIIVRVQKPGITTVHVKKHYIVVVCVPKNIVLPMYML